MLLRIVMRFSVKGRHTVPCLASCLVLATLSSQKQSVVPPAFNERVASIVAKNPLLQQEKYRTIKELDLLGLKEMQTRATFPKLVRGDPKLPTITLTFDDGPYPDYTPKLLSILKTAGVKATFFNIGYKVEANPELVLAEARDGHEIANHTYHHLRLPGLPSQAVVEQELFYGQEAIRKLLGKTKPIDLCRPPGGQYDDKVIAAETKYQYTMALWTDDPGDYRGISAAEIQKILLRDLSKGGIILLHDGVKNTQDALPGFIAEAKKRGYQFVTCSTLMNQAGCIKSGGPNTYTGK